MQKYAEKFYAMATANGEAEAERFYKTAEREKQQHEKRIKELDNIIRCLYEDRVCGRITPERYDTMASGYEQKQTVLKEKLIAVNNGISRMDMRDSCIREFITKAKEYIEMPTLIPNSPLRTQRIPSAIFCFNKTETLYKRFKNKSELKSKYQIYLEEVYEKKVSIPGRE